MQSTHAAINFQYEHPSRAGPWFKSSNYLVQLVAEDEEELRYIISRCERLGIAYTAFREPDIGNQITAIAIEPSPATKKLVRKYPLLFKQKINSNENFKATADSPENNGYQIPSIQPDQN